MRFKALIFFLLSIVFGIKAQNWNAFNSAYRFNYIYDHNALITNVLFADSIKQNGADTVYYMNRIGVECQGTCPTITTAITTTATVIVPNMPQFLQRAIVKKADGTVLLQDTSNWLIKPKCILNETWTFDAVNSKTAQCVSISTISIFSIIDSLKTIIIDGTDSLLLCKNFGLIQFPNVYGKNKYYRLVGIEKTSSYDLNALFGVKVPNAWDFYNFDIGDKFCNTDFLSWGGMASGPNGYHNIVTNEEITGKMIQQGTDTRFIYAVKIKSKSQVGWPIPPVQYSETLATQSYTPTVKSFENKMYPGQIVLPDFSGTFNIVKYGMDSNGRFYKYSGYNCLTYTNVTMPNNIAYNGFYFSSPLLYQTNYADRVSFVYGVGMGLLTYQKKHIGYYEEKCITCAFKNGTLYLGQETFVGNEENVKDRNMIRLYPNPTSNSLMIDLGEIEVSEIRLIDLFGKTIKSVSNFETDKTSIDLKDHAPGIYFLQVYNDGKLIDVRKVIKN